jgi:hypothetical protein
VPPTRGRPTDAIANAAAPHASAVRPATSSRRRPRGAANQHTFQASADIEVDTDERRKAPAGQHLHGETGRAAADGASCQQRDGPPRAHRRFGHLEACADTRTGHRAAPEADECEHGNDGK